MFGYDRRLCLACRRHLLSLHVWICFPSMRPFLSPNQQMTIVRGSDQKNSVPSEAEAYAYGAILDECYVSGLVSNVLSASHFGRPHMTLRPPNHNRHLQDSC